jgi:isopentenyl phosphate kinase
MSTYQDMAQLLVLLHGAGHMHHELKRANIPGVMQSQERFSLVHGCVARLGICRGQGLMQGSMQGSMFV